MLLICTYPQFHPGGARILLKALGTDATALFNKHHAWIDADYLLSRRAVGWLQAVEPAPAAAAAADLIDLIKLSDSGDPR